MKSKKEKRGRKPLGKEKKKRVDLFVPETVIKAIGKPKILEVSYLAIDNELKSK